MSSARVTARVEESVKSDGVNDDQSLYLIKGDNSSIPLEVAQSKDRKIRPLKLFNTKKYVIVNFDRWNSRRLMFGETNCTLVMMRKTDGAMFCAESDLHCDPRWDTCDDNTVQTDASGDLIYTIQNGTVQKLDMRDPRNLTVTNVIENGVDGGANELAVNASGDALVVFSSSNGKRYMRAYNSHGGMTNLGYGWSYQTCLVSGQDKDAERFYYVDSMLGAVVQVDRIDGKFSQSIYYNYLLNGDRYSGFDCRAGSARITRVTDHIYVRPNTPGILVDLINPDHQPKEIVLPEIQELKKMVGSNSEVLLSGVNERGDSLLLSFNSVTSEFATLVPAGMYSFTAIGLSPNGTASFSGQRFSDSARVVAEIASGSLKIKVTSFDFGQVSQIVQIF